MQTWFCCGAVGDIARHCIMKGKVPRDEMSYAPMLTHSSSLACTSKRNKAQRWMLDSGCTRHVVNEKSILFSVVAAERSVQVENIGIVWSYGHGTVEVMSVVNWTRYMITLQSVFLVLDIIDNFASASRAFNNRFRISIDVSEKYPGTEAIELYHKAPLQVTMNWSKAMDGLFVLAVQQQEWMPFAMPWFKSVWPQCMGNRVGYVLQNLLLHEQGI